MSKGESQSELTGLDGHVKYYRLELGLNPDSTGPASTPGKFVRGLIRTLFYFQQFKF